MTTESTLSNAIRDLLKPRILSGDELSSYQRAATGCFLPTTQHPDGKFVDPSTQRMLAIWHEAIAWTCGRLQGLVGVPAAEQATTPSLPLSAEQLDKAAYALIAAFDDPTCSLASLNNYARDLERALVAQQATASRGEPSMIRREVFAICDAYESGMGHGLQRDGHKDGAIFSNPNCAAAYEIGYEAGEGRPSKSVPARASHGAQAQPAGEQFDWMKAERIRDEDHVDEALRNFREDPTGDNAAGIIQAALTVWNADVAALANRASSAKAEPVELMGVREEMEKGSGFWSSCSGCYDTEDGHPTGPYSYSTVFGCALGNGCSECGGLGAVWDDTDYEALEKEFEAATQASDTRAAVLEEAAKMAIKLTAVPRDVLGPATVPMKARAIAGEQIATAIRALAAAPTAAIAEADAKDAALWRFLIASMEESESKDDAQRLVKIVDEAMAKTGAGMSAIQGALAAMSATQQAQNSAASQVDPSMAIPSRPAEGGA